MNGGPSPQSVWGEGPRAKALGLLVGEGPGRDEAELGRPFVGMTGQALDEELMRAGIPRAQLRIVNATCCQPKQPKKETEMHAAAVACRPAFLHQVKDVPEDTPIFAMGRWAAFAVTLKSKGVMKVRGFIRWTTKVPRKEEGNE